ncbi:hypothetical protein Hanom_Chr12g01109621 [Helianthus anomalus]
MVGSACSILFSKYDFRSLVTSAHADTRTLMAFSSVTTLLSCISFSICTFSTFCCKDTVC